MRGEEQNKFISGLIRGEITSNSTWSGSETAWQQSPEPPAEADSPARPPAAPVAPFTPSDKLDKKLDKMLSMQDKWNFSKLQAQMISLFYHFGRLRNDAALPAPLSSESRRYAAFSYVAALCWNLFFLNPIFSLFSVSLNTPKYQREEGILDVCLKSGREVLSLISTKLGASSEMFLQLVQGPSAACGPGVKCEGSAPNETMTPTHSRGGPPEEQQEP